MADKKNGDLLKQFAAMIAEEVVKLLPQTAAGEAAPTEPSEDTPVDTDLANATDDAPADEATPPETDDSADGEADKDADGDATEEAITDGVTAEQFAVVDAMEDADSASASAGVETMKEALLAFYSLMGHEKKQVVKHLASQDEDELRADYREYLGRLVAHQDGKLDFCSDLESPYRALRLEGDAAEWRWVKGGVTMAADECADLGDAEPPKPKPKAKTMTKPAAKPAAKPVIKPGRKLTPAK